MKLIACAVLVGGCGFQIALGSDDTIADDADVIDTMGSDDGTITPGARDIPHVPPSYEMPGTESWTITGTVNLTTNGAAIQASAPIPSTAAIVAQTGGGPELAIIRADSVTISAGSSLNVTGTRPLVIIASSINIAGTLDASAHLATPGPGGKLPTTVAPWSGVHMGTYGDSAGGGGAFTATSGVGGSANTTCSTLAVGGASGTAFGTPSLDTLEGGGGGGRGSMGSCTFASGGAGGGAVQLTAHVALTIATSGRVLVGGGGGKGGVFCNNDDAGAAGGGGSGGAIYLDAPMIIVAGKLAANGGGGGGGGCGPGGSGGDGQDGQVESAASSGEAGGGCGVAGGAGAAGVMSAQNGGTNGCDGNAGGGGGAVGRIVLHHAATSAPVISGGISPPATNIAY